MPNDKALFFPMVNVECSLLEGTANGCANTVAENRDIVADIINRAPLDKLAADVDGVAVPINANYRVGYSQKPAFSFRLPPDDLLSFIGEGPFHPGTYPGAVDDGYYVMLAPLPAGSHKVHFHGEVPDFSFVLDVTYDLKVTR